MIRTDLPPEIVQALWAGDVDLLIELTGGCGCCCAEHTFESCPARLWDGCRGSGTMTRAEERAWMAFYVNHRGLTEAQFYGLVEEAEAPQR